MGDGERGESDEMSGEANRMRCTWAAKPINIPYHDQEWGVPVREDRVWFEFLILEGAQAGLSWDTILAKRDRYRKLFAGFDPKKVARFDKKRERELLKDPGIIRNRLKIAAAVTNAKAFLAVQKEFGSFNAFIWKFVGGKPIQGARAAHGGIPAQTELSVRLSKELLKRGFRFVGPTICYAFLQATGVVNDHLASCFRHDAIARMGEKSLI